MSLNELLEKLYDENKTFKRVVDPDKGETYAIIDDERDLI